MHCRSHPSVHGLAGSRTLGRRRQAEVLNRTESSTCFRTAAIGLPPTPVRTGRRKNLTLTSYGHGTASALSAGSRREAPSRFPQRGAATPGGTHHERRRR